MARLVSKTDLARIAGVAKPSISKACQRNFPGALVGLRVDVDHPDVQRYLADKDGASTRLAEMLANPPSVPPAPLPSTTPPELAPAPAQVRGAARRIANATGATDKLAKPTTTIDLSGCLDMTLREVFEHFGTLPQFIDVLDATRRVADITERNLKIAERSGRLISRDFVRTHVFAHLDALARRLLTDMPATLVRKARANLPIEVAEANARELISSQLQQAKEEIRRALAHGEQASEERAA